MPYFKLFYGKNSRKYGEKNSRSRKRWLGFSSRFGFAETYFAISWAVIVRFLNVLISLNSVFSQLSNAVFQIPNLRRYSEKKKENRKRWLGFSSEFRFVQTYFTTSRAVVVWFLNVLISLDLYFYIIVLRQKNAKIRWKEYERKRWLGFSLRFGFAETYYAISRAVVIRFLIFLYH